MVIDPIFRWSQLTLPVATVIGSAWVMANGYSPTGFGLLFGGSIFTIILRLIEQGIFADNIQHGRYDRINY